MASVQARLREKVTDEGVILVEKDIVPKMATHFESLAEKARDGERESERKRREGKNEKTGFVGQVKDKAVVVGWGTAQYTLEKVADITGEKVVVATGYAAATTDAVVPEKFMGMFLEEEQGGSSIFEAIGETIMEIGQTTKAFLLGFNPIQHKDETEEH